MRGQRIHDAAALFLFGIAIVCLLFGCITAGQGKDTGGGTRQTEEESAPDGQGDDKPTAQPTESGAMAIVTIDRVGCPDPVTAGFKGVRWLNANVTAWPETATLREVRIHGSHIRLDYDKAGVWPATLIVSGQKLVGNPWVFFQVDGQWIAGTFEWLRPGSIDRDVAAVNGDHLTHASYNGWSPKSGEWYGFMLSGGARNTQRNVEERSNVVMFQWP